MQNNKYNQSAVVGSKAFDKVFNVSAVAVSSRALNFRNRTLSIDDSLEDLES